jgi:SAM-dependent methyltransferase
MPLLNRLLALKGIHYLVTRFGSRSLRSLAFDEKYRRGNWDHHNDGGSELTSIVLRHLRNGDLLVLGCGSATVLDGVETSGLNSALGVDLSREAIRLASRFACARIHFLIQDMELLELTSSYDVILFSESLYYVPLYRQSALLQRLSNHLKEGGVFIVTLSEPKRYAEILNNIRGLFDVQEDRPFVGSSRHILVFTASASAGIMSPSGPS